VSFLADFLVNLLDQAGESGPPHRRSKEQRAIELLLRDLELSDEVIRRCLSTTERQMLRWTNYKILRLLIKRQLHAS